MFRDVARDKTTFVDSSVIAQEKCKGLNFHLANAQNLPFPDNSFDVAVLGEILEHVEDPPKVLQEALRVCRKKMLITTPNEHEWTPDAKPFTTVGHIRFYTEQMLRDHLSQAGIKNYDMFKIKGGSWCFFAVEVIK
jgi:ubiquinone/menaquinone biosynthesis C-methylase UbiE